MKRAFGTYHCLDIVFKVLILLEQLATQLKFVIKPKLVLYKNKKLSVVFYFVSLHKLYI